MQQPTNNELQTLRSLAIDDLAIIQDVLNAESPPDYEQHTVVEMATRLKELKTQLEQASAIKTHIQKAYDYLSISVLPDRMDEEKIKTLKIIDVGRLQAKPDIRCNVLAKNREAMKQWLTDNGHGSMVSSTINSSSLKAFIKERIKEEKPYPEDLLNVEAYSRATVVKG